MAVICPISNTNRGFPLHIKLDSRTKTMGAVLCEHIKSLDVESRGYRFIERLPEDLLVKVINTATLGIKIDC